MKNIRVKEAATYVGLSKSSLDKLRCFGGGPRFYKLGRSVVYNTADLDAWMSERARTSTWCANDNTPARTPAA
ncbi:helix-turn-helix domain-containing protein [Bradyrhizobium sp. BRP14]|nr:helix-turn-helix domain-containing protein [Bradyrhizobium sp. BRP14]